MNSFLAYSRISEHTSLRQTTCWPVGRFTDVWNKRLCGRGFDRQTRPWPKPETPGLMQISDRGVLSVFQLSWRQIRGQTIRRRLAIEDRESSRIILVALADSSPSSCAAIPRRRARRHRSAWRRGVYLETDPCCGAASARGINLPKEWPFVGHRTGRKPMHQIIYIVGAIVIVLVILGFFGLR